MGREVPGTPLVHVKRGVVVLEPVSEATKRVKAEVSVFSYFSPFFFFCCYCCCIRGRGGTLFYPPLCFFIMHADLKFDFFF